MENKYIACYVVHMKMLYASIFTIVENPTDQSLMKLHTIHTFVRSNVWQLLQLTNMYQRLGCVRDKYCDHI